MNSQSIVGSIVRVLLEQPLNQLIQPDRTIMSDLTNVTRIIVQMLHEHLSCVAAYKWCFTG